MNILDELNAFNEITFVPSVSELKVNTSFKIIKFKLITQYKKRLVAVEIKNKETNVVHLPDRFSDFFSKEKIEEMNKEENLWLTYRGKRTSGKMTFHDVTFTKVSSDEEEKPNV